MNIPEIKMRIQALQAIEGSRWLIIRDMELTNEQKLRYLGKLLENMFKHIEALTKAIQE